ncbi:MAG: tetratricopeptide repeat protein, partial [Myxococcota bacterium]
QLRIGDLDGAEHSWVECLKLKPSYTESRLELGKLLKKAGRLGEARAQLETATAANPSAIQTRLLLVELCEEMGDLRAAENHLKTLINLRPANAWDYYRLGRFYERTGQADKAREQFEISERLQPSKDNRKLRALLPSKK